MDEKTFEALDEPALAGLAARMAGVLQAPLVLWLQGDLGAGKTTFARALIQALGYPGRVKSPTYGLLETYAVQGMQLVHMDLYRIKDAGELEFLGLDDLLVENSVLLVEWPQHGGQALPQPDLIVALDHQQERRKATFQAHSEAGIRLLDAF